MDQKPIIVTGSAENLFTDLLDLRLLIKPYECDALCVNRSALYYPYFFQHWASLHPEIINNNLRWLKNKCSFRTHSNRIAPGIETVWPLDAFGGDSGLFGVRVAIRLGYKKIILCGMPLDGRPKIYEYKTVKNGFDCTVNQGLWKDTAKEEFEDLVRSMSGNTKEMLGYPTKEWLQGGNNGLES